MLDLTQTKPTFKNRLKRFFLGGEGFLTIYLCYLYCFEIQGLHLYTGKIHVLFIAWASSILLYKLLMKRRNLFKLPNLMPFVLLFAANFLTVFLNRSVNLSGQLRALVLNGVSLFLIFPIAYWSGSRRHDPHGYYRILKPVYLLHAVGTQLSLWLFAFGVNWRPVLQGRPRQFGVNVFSYGKTQTMLLFGIYVDPNHIALFCLVSMFVALYWLRTKPKLERWKTILHSLNLVAQFIFLVLANSRGAILALAFSLFCLSLYWAYCHLPQQKGLFQKVVVLVLALFLPLGGLFALQKGVGAVSLRYYKFVKTLKMSSSQGSAVSPAPELEPELQKGTLSGESTRVRLVKEGIELFKRHPIVGIGVDNTKPYAERELGEAYKILKTGKALHSSYLDVLVSFGALGFGLWLFVLLRSVYVLYPLLRRRLIVERLALILAALAALLAGVGFISTAYLSSSFLYATLLLLAGYLRGQFELCRKQAVATEQA